MSRLQKIAALPLDVVDGATPVEAAMQADGDEPGLARHEAGPLSHQRQRLRLLPRLGLDDRDLSYGLIVGSDVWHRRPRLIGNGFAVSLLAVEGPTRAIEHSVDLARHDEIVLVQSLDLLGAQGDGRVTPAEADVGVMAFGLGELTDFLNKGERFPEIAESKRALDAVGIVSQLPIGSLCLQALGFITREWRDAAATRRACLLGECLGHILVLKPIIKAIAGVRSS